MKRDEEFLLEDIANELPLPDDRELRACWNVILSALRDGQLGIEDIGETIRFARVGGDYGSDEVHFDRIGGRIRVSFLGEKVYCAPEALIALLDQLRERYAAVRPAAISGERDVPLAARFDNTFNIPNDAALARSEQGHDGPSNDVPNTVQKATREHST